MLLSFGRLTERVNGTLHAGDGLFFSDCHYEGEHVGTNGCAHNGESQ